ncbi:MAG: hypothetical protein QOE36_2881, partial [Gaiellaceae bacterium]|nr:hypothetical protein [Gaiellaceae bacterium]
MSAVEKTAGAAAVPHEPGAAAGAASDRVARLRAWRLRHRTALRSALAAYGIVLALIGVVQAGAPGTTWAGRTREFNAAVPVFAAGGPPLTYRNGASLAPAGRADDKGLWLYLEPVSRATGNRDLPSLLHWWFFAPTLALLLALYPLIFAELFGSLAAGVAAPLLVLVTLPRLQLSDIYWASAWAPLLGIPLVLLAYRRSTARRFPVWLTLIVLVAGAASTLRSNAGLGVALAAAIAALLRVRGWRSCAAVVAVLAVGYVATSNTLVSGVRHERDAAVGVAGFDDSPIAHPLWHPAYLGLGYFTDNPYGIRWLDDSGFEAARRVDSQVHTGSTHYEAILRGLYLHIVRTDPGFVAHTYASKAIVALKDAGYLLWVLPAAAAMAVLGGRRERRYLLMALPAAPIGIASPMLGLPLRFYSLGWYAALVLLLALVVGWVLPEGLRLARQVAASGVGALAGRHRYRAIQAVVSAAVVAFLIHQVPAAAQGVADEVVYRNQAVRAVPAALVSGERQAGWSLVGGIARAGWSAEPETVARSV